MTMPIYEYQHDSEKGAGCKDVFDAFQSMSDSPLWRCPTCGQPCHRILSTFGVGAHGKAGILSKSNLEAHGFTQFTRRGKGYYEKTAGVGPKAIASDD
jgi:putative FmdB family regulatory protein